VPLDRDKLAKMLAMTTSDKDPEVLAAISMCNAMLKKENVTWGDILKDVPRDVRISISREPYQQDENWKPPHLCDKVMIDLMFRTIYSAPRTGSEDFWRFIDDVHGKFRKWGSLTQGQFTAIQNVYKRASKKNPT
jgi:hypothetical protein